MTGVPADLGTKEGVNLLIRDVPVVDILVNNPGIFEPKPFSEITDEDWLRFFEVNVLSGARLSRFYLPQMLQKNWGRIVFISSESGVNIPVEMVHYGVTKTAQIALARLALPWSCCRRCARRKRQRAASIARPHDASAADISTRAEIAAAWPPCLGTRRPEDLSEHAGGPGGRSGADRSARVPGCRPAAGGRSPGLVDGRLPNVLPWQHRVPARAGTPAPSHKRSS